MVPHSLPQEQMFSYQMMLVAPAPRLIYNTYELLEWNCLHGNTCDMTDLELAAVEIKSQFVIR